MSAENSSIAELREHAETLLEQVRALADEIKAVLHIDLPEYINRELKRSFVSHPDFAQTVNNDTLLAIKKQVASAGNSARDRIIDALNDPELWTPTATTENQKSIADNAAVWRIVQTIGETVTEIRKQHSFPDANDPVEYKAPTWFIERRYLPSIGEKYWRLLREANEAKRQIDEAHSNESKGRLAQRWDDA